MFIRRSVKMKPVIAVPRGAIVPANIEVPFVNEGTFIEKLVANTEHVIAIVQLTTEELIALVEKPHLFGVDVIALVGVPGGKYDAVWSSYTAPLRRVSLDTLDAEIKAVMAKHSATSSERVHKQVQPTLPEQDDDNEGMVTE